MKRNVMKTGVLWNEVVTATHNAGYEDVALDHMLADAGGMKLVQNPKHIAPNARRVGLRPQKIEHRPHA